MIDVQSSIVTEDNGEVYDEVDRLERVFCF